MTIRTLLFAHLQDYLGPSVEMDIPAGSTVCDLADALAARDKRFEGVLNYARVARNGDYCLPDERLSDADEVAVMPPVSGG